MTQQTTVFGVIGTDPEQISARTGAPMVSFRLAHNHRFFSQESNEWVQGSTSWFTVTAYRNLAQNITAHLSKGDRVFVVGRLQVREFDREDGSRGKDICIIAESVGPDLRFNRNGREEAQAAHGWEALGAPPRQNPQFPEGRQSLGTGAEQISAQEPGAEESAQEEDLAVAGAPF